MYARHLQFEAAEASRRAGNTSYASGAYVEAEGHYRAGSSMLDKVEPANDAEILAASSAKVHGLCMRHVARRL